MREVASEKEARVEMKVASFKTTPRRLPCHGFKCIQARVAQAQRADSRLRTLV